MILATVLMSSLPFIAVDFPLEQLPPQFEVQRHANGGHGPATTIVAADKTYRELAALLNAERSGWKREYATYVPQLTFQSKGMNINCTGKLIVVNYTARDGTPHQISKQTKQPCPG